MLIITYICQYNANVCTAIEIEGYRVVERPYYMSNCVRTLNKVNCDR